MSLSEPLPVSVRLRELVARDAQDFAVGQPIRPANGECRDMVCMPSTVPSECVWTAAAVVGCRRSGVHAPTLASTARPLVGLILNAFRKSHGPQPPKAAPGPRVGSKTKLRYADLGNGSAVCLWGDRDGLSLSVPVPQFTLGLRPRSPPR